MRASTAPAKGGEPDRSLTSAQRRSRRRSDIETRKPGATRNTCRTGRSGTVERGVIRNRTPTIAFDGPRRGPVRRGLVRQHPSRPAPTGNRPPPANATCKRVVANLARSPDFARFVLLGSSVVGDRGAGVKRRRRRERESWVAFRSAPEPPGTAQILDLATTRATRSGSVPHNDTNRDVDAPARSKSRICAGQSPRRERDSPRTPSLQRRRSPARQPPSADPHQKHGFA